MTLRELWDRYRSCRLLGCRPATLKEYLAALHHVELVAGAISPESLDQAMLCSMAEGMLRAELQPATVNKTLRHVLALLRFAAEEGLVAQVPRWKRLREPRRVPTAFLVEEFGRVLAAAGAEEGSVGGVPAAAWWRSLLLATWYSGARIGAMLGVTRADVLLEAPGFYVRAPVQKQHADQFFAVDSETVEALRAAWSPERLLMWPWPHVRGLLYKRFRQIVDRAGVPTPGGTGPLFHRIRRSTASYLKRAGGDATAQLGHSTPTVTQRYFDPRIVGTVNTVALLPRPKLPD